MVVKEESKRFNYFFPDLLGRVMSKVDLRTQLEANLLSMTLMFFGLITTIIYIAIYVNFPLWYKIFLDINLVAGLAFFLSNIITTYQQYQNFMAVRQFQEDMKGGNIKK